MYALPQVRIATNDFKPPSDRLDPPHPQRARIVNGWNSLPETVVCSPCINSFKNGYDNYERCIEKRHPYELYSLFIPINSFSHEDSYVFYLPGLIVMNSVTRHECW